MRNCTGDHLVDKLVFGGRAVTSTVSRRTSRLIVGEAISLPPWYCFLSALLNGEGF